MRLNEEDGKLVACSCNNSFVGVWVVDLNKIRPFSGPAIRKAHAASGQCCMQETQSGTLHRNLGPGTGTKLCTAMTEEALLWHCVVILDHADTVRRGGESCCHAKCSTEDKLFVLIVSVCFSTHSQHTLDTAALTELHKGRALSCASSMACVLLHSLDTWRYDAGIDGHSQRPCLMSTSSPTGRSTVMTQPQQEQLSPSLAAGVQ